MTPRTLLRTSLVAVATVAACATGYAGVHAAGNISPSAAAPAALTLHDSSAGASGNSAQASSTDDTTVSVTTLTQTQFNSSLVGVHTCAPLGAMRFCQDIESSRTHLPTWDVYADLGQARDLGGGQMVVSTVDQQAATPLASAAAVGPYVKLHWSSSSIDITDGSQTYTQVTLGGQAYSFDCSASELPDHSWTGFCTLQAGEQ